MTTGAAVLTWSLTTGAAVLAKVSVGIGPGKRSESRSLALELVAAGGFGKPEMLARRSVVGGKLEKSAQLAFCG